MIPGARKEYLPKNVITDRGIYKNFLTFRATAAIASASHSGGRRTSSAKFIEANQRRMTRLNNFEDASCRALNIDGRARSTASARYQKVDASHVCCCVLRLCLKGAVCVVMKTPNVQRNSPNFIGDVDGGFVPAELLSNCDMSDHSFMNA